MEKILLIGANGFIGHNLLNALCSEYTVCAVSKHENIEISGDYQFICCDLEDKGALYELMTKFSPDVIINTAAVSSPDFCENHREIAKAINVNAVKVMSDYCNMTGARLIHLSTDFVFSGDENKLYSETDETNPANFYGTTKLESENYVLANCANAVVVRVEVVYGDVLPGQHSNIVLFVKQSLESGKKIRVVNDQFRTPTYVDDVINGIVSIIKNDVSGIFHICGKEYLSILDMAYQVAMFWQLDSSLIEAVSTVEMNEATRRPQYSGMSIEKAKQLLGYKPISFAESLKYMK